VEGGLERHLMGPEAAVPRLARRQSGAGRVLLFGDFLDVDRDAVLRLAGGRRRIHLGQVLSSSEWSPAPGHSFADPEASPAPEAATAAVGAQLAQYRRRLEGFVEGWADLARAHGMGHAAWSSSDAFESYLPGLLR